MKNVVFKQARGCPLRKKLPSGNYLPYYCGHPAMKDRKMLNCPPGNFECPEACPLRKESLGIWLDSDPNAPRETRRAS